jgi:hypothetical protein
MSAEKKLSPPQDIEDTGEDQNGVDILVDEFPLASELPLA